MCAVCLWGFDGGGAWSLNQEVDCLVGGGNILIILFAYPWCLIPTNALHSWVVLRASLLWTIACHQKGNCLHHLQHQPGKQYKIQKGGTNACRQLFWWKVTVVMVCVCACSLIYCVWESVWLRLGGSKAMIREKKLLINERINKCVFSFLMKKHARQDVCVHGYPRE